MRTARTVRRRRLTAVLGALGLAMAGMVAVATSAEAVASACDAVAGNLVQNCGFETGNLNDWSSSGSFIEATSPPGGAGYVHTGGWGALMGTVSPSGTLAQTIAGTNPGTTYDFSYWMDDPLGGTPNAFKVVVSNVVGGAVTYDSVTNVGVLPWAQFTHTFTTLSNGTPPTISFIAWSLPSAWGIDDVSVVRLHPPAVAAGSMSDPGGLTVTTLDASSECVSWALTGYAPYAPVTIIAYPTLTHAVPSDLGRYDANASGRVTVNVCLPDTSRGAYTLLAAGYAGNGNVLYEKAQTIVQP